MTTLERRRQPANLKPAITRRTLVIGLIVAAGTALFVFANAHLVYVAETSQPDCVAHLKAPDAASGSFRAAKSAC
jgi:hypothetical protein